MVGTKTARMCNRFSRDRRGVAAAEFALVLPFLMTMFFGVVKFGVALNHNLALTDGVRAGSRQLAISRSTNTPYTDTTSRLRAATPGLNPAVTGAQITITVNGTPCSSDATCKTALSTAAGQSATVSAVYTCDVVILGVDFAPSCQLSSQTTERVE